MFVLDTNTFIYFFKGQGHVAERLLEVPPGEVLMPAPVLYELELGSLQSSAPRKRREQIQDLLDVVAVAPFGALEARAAARIRADLEREGRGIGPLDNLIAGTAVARSATLVTHNLGEFARVRGLKLEDWYD
jgi:tRNA(fMet)-specific endonuclease VapC